MAAVAVEKEPNAIALAVVAEDEMPVVRCRAKVGHGCGSRQGQCYQLCKMQENSTVKVRLVSRDSGKFKRLKIEN